MLPVMVTDMAAGRGPRGARPLPLLTGQRLEYVRLGDVIVLSFSGGSQVLIETVARLSAPGGPEAGDIEPGDHHSDALATLLGDFIRSARTRATGELELCFASGSELLIGADPDVESWAVAGPRGFLIVCLAGGELATWGDASTHQPG